MDITDQVKTRNTKYKKVDRNRQTPLKSHDTRPEGAIIRFS